jgi:hypothetical protein
MGPNKFLTAFNAEYDSFKDKIDDGTISPNELSNKFGDAIRRLGHGNTGKNMLISDCLVIKRMGGYYPYSANVAVRLGGLANQEDFVYHRSTDEETNGLSVSALRLNRNEITNELVRVKLLYDSSHK